MGEELTKHTNRKGQTDNDENALLSKIKQQICISPEPGTNQFWQWNQVGGMLTHHRHGLLSVRFCLILDRWVGLSVDIQSDDNLVSQTSKFRILHSAEEDNLSPFDSNLLPCAIALSKSNNKYLLRTMCAGQKLTIYTSWKGQTDNDVIALLSKDHSSIVSHWWLYFYHSSAHKICTLNGNFFWISIPEIIVYKSTVKPGIKISL